MADGNLGTDLFGDPLTLPREGPGRPPHVATPETRNRVLLCLVRGLSLKDTATVIGISVPTLRKEYFAELAKRKAAALKMEMRQLERLNAQAEAGNIAAEKELDKRIDKLRLRDQGETIGKRRKAAPAEAKPKGKKEQQQDAAKGVGGKFGTRQPPPGALLQ